MTSIITSCVKLDVGTIMSGETIGIPFEDFDGKKYYEYTMFVLREATREEYVSHCEQVYQKKVGEDLIEYDYFYEISMD